MQKRKLGSIKSNILLLLVLVTIATIFVVAKYSGRVIPNVEGAVGNIISKLHPLVK